MSSTFHRLLLAPRVPNVGAGFIDDSFAVVDLRRARRGFAVAASAITQLRPGLVTPEFDSTNIHNSTELSSIVSQTAEAAGLSRKKRWSVALPEGAARTLVISLESKPSSKRELDEVLTWKIERVIASDATELRISRQRLSPVAGQERYLVTVARDHVLSEYEEVFESVGWQCGLLLPRHMGEAQWLLWDTSPGDKMLVSGNRCGFTSVVVRDRQPILVRSHVCEPSSSGDELHRFALYYRDRILEASGKPGDLTGLLVIGEIDPAEACRAVKDALDTEPRALDPAQFGFDLQGEPIRFDQLAGAAGLASLAWQ